MKKKITALVLAVAMCCTLLVAPVSAARVDDYHAPWGSPKSGSFPAGSDDPGAWYIWTSKFDTRLYQDLDIAIQYFAKPLEVATGWDLSFETSSQYGDAYWNYQVDAYGVGSCSLVWLTWWADILTNRMNEPEAIYQLVQGEYQRVGSLPPYQKLGLSRFNIAVRDDPTTGYKRLYDYGNGVWVVDSNGLYPFYAPSTSTATTGYQWLRMADVSAALSSGDSTLSMTSRSALSTICDNLSSELGESVRLYTWDDHFQCAYRRNGALILCDNDGNPLMCPLDESQFQGAQGGRGEDSKVVDPDTGVESDPVAGNQSQVNYTTYQIVLPDGNTQSIDGCYFNNDGDAYVVQTQSNGLINTGDTIVNSYNTYEYTYNISYTSITYIGSSAEFTPEAYDVYYTLPDGRSSADLTKEDLEQLNLSMDVVEYQRSADDTRLRSLYHFDGNTEDASYWNYATSFDWTSGASLTYLESNAFNGCLYLDELAHDFSITLPSSIGSGDFTVDFRYYQAHSGTPSDDSYISIGGQEVLRLSGSHFTFNGSNYATPVGSWNHLAFVRKDGTLYFYLNGVRQGSRALSNALSSIIRFSFGSSQQTYKYLDELRVTNFAVWESNFTPPTVPYDTNLSLVLPTDTVPVADEYWDIQCENNLLSQYNLDWWDASHGLSGGLSSYSLRWDSIVGLNGVGNYKLVVSDTSITAAYPYFTYLSNFVNLSQNDYSSFSVYNNVLSGRTISTYYPYSYAASNGQTVSSSVNTAVCCYTRSALGFSSIIQICEYYSGYNYYDFLPAGAYTLTMVSSDGSIGTFSFSFSDLHIDSEGVISSINFNGYEISLYNSSFGHSYNSKLAGYTLHSTSASKKHSVLSLSINPTSDAGEFVYLALEPGTESTVTAEFVSGVAGIPADDLNTPTLAVRSDIAINNKQIGGVRPSFAQRGDVYAMVESGFITSLQQYTGYAWQSVDGRIWTGSRWIPYSSYNVITLSDMYDIADASGQGGYEYIYSQQGFWAWLQKWLMQFKTDLFEKLNGLGSGSSGECKHSYSAEVISDPTCTESGSTRYTCSKCGDIYTEAVSPLGHNYVASEVVEDHYSMPDGAACPECGSSDFTHTLDADTEMYHCVCSDCDEEFDVDAEFEYGYTVYTCTRCDEEYTESNKSKSGLFEAIGDFLADGIQWIGDKLVRLVDAFSGLSDIFRNFAESVKENAGGFPTLFGQVFALIPEDLQTIIWFSLIASVIVAVWKKWFS